MDGEKENNIITRQMNNNGDLLACISDVKLMCISE